MMLQRKKLNLSKTLLGKMTYTVLIGRKRKFEKRAEITDETQIGVQIQIRAKIKIGQESRVKVRLREEVKLKPVDKVNNRDKVKVKMGRLVKVQVVIEEEDR